MPAVNIVVESEVSRSTRCQQLEAMFDVPPQDRSKLEWTGDLPIEKSKWNIGLIVGPSGCGKSTIAKELFKTNYCKTLKWKEKAVIDDFANDLSIKDIAKACSSVGFNTIPAWFRPYDVLSTGEKFRVDIARRLLELPDPIVVDEFTSVVDRQVAQVGAYAVQKFIRKNNRQLIAVTCHYDVIDWLMPDWVFEPATMTYKPRGSLQQVRPKIDIEIKRAGYKVWQIFAPFHYLTADLSTAARCFCIFINGQPVSLAAVLHRPNWKKRGQDIKGISRSVTLPDWQGMGLNAFLVETLGAAYKAIGWRLRAYPSHPIIIRVMDKQMSNWKMIKKPGYLQKTNAQNVGKRKFRSMRNVSRPGAVFEYCGEPMDRKSAEELINCDLQA